MDSEPNAHMIEVVRDPRRIYASWLTTSPFKDMFQRSVWILTDICESFAANMDFEHPRLHRIIFEELVTEPTRIMGEMYDFLGQDVGPEQRSWIVNTFNATKCPDVTRDNAAYRDCHQKWRAKWE